MGLRGPAASAFLVFSLAFLVFTDTVLCSAQAAEYPVSLEATPRSITLGNQFQRVAFTRDATGHYLLSASVLRGSRWEQLFTSLSPVVTGSCFDLYPTEAEVVRNTASAKAVMLSGVHASPDYAWDMLVEARSETPLIRFRVTCHLTSDLVLPGPQPSVALWMTGAKPEVMLDQGPDSIYGPLGISHCLGFPAAYAWHGGLEAVVFFNMTPATWMSTDGVQRFLSVRVGSQSIGGITGLGMHCGRLSGKRIQSGDMVIEFYLYSASRPKRPTKLQALDTMVRICAPLHPATSVFPRNHVDGGDVSWSQFAAKTVQDLMVEGVTYADLNAQWADSPLDLVEPSAEMVVHPGHAASSPEQAQREWDFSTVNNHLSAWELYSRLNPDRGQQQLLRLKRDALPRFFDPKDGMIRWGTRQPEHVGDMEMTWQNLFFHIETMRAVEAASPGDLNPAVTGRFLMSARTLMDYAHKVDYVFPQWFDPYKLTPLVQNDARQLGVVREPWQVGAYAYVMMRAYGISGERVYRDEAATSIRRLMNTMSYTVANDVYTRTYSDPADFPITELFGNAYGAVAAYEVYRATGDSGYLRYSRDFTNTLLRLTFWYEDQTDAVSRELRNAGLFYPHGGAHVATPWETTEAHLCIASLLKHDAASPIYGLLLKLSNLNRINSFYFYPAACSDAVLGSRQPGVGQYFPFEPFYCLEGPGGHRGQTAAYMSGMSMWNYWLYEALAEADDRGVMVLNLDALDGYDEAVSGARRSFVVFNPGSRLRKCRVLLKHLPEGKYRLTIQPPSAEAHTSAYQGSELTKGISISMAPSSYVRLDITRISLSPTETALREQRLAGSRLSCVYARLQLAATREASSSRLAPLQRRFAAAVEDYRSHRYASVLAATRAISAMIE